MMNVRQERWSGGLSENRWIMRNGVILCPEHRDRWCGEDIHQTCRRCIQCVRKEDTEQAEMTGIITVMTATAVMIGAVTVRTATAVMTGAVTARTATAVMTGVTTGRTATTETTGAAIVRNAITAVMDTVPMIIEIICSMRRHPIRLILI